MSDENIPGEGEIKEVWESYWSGYDRDDSWDSISDTVLGAIQGEWQDLEGSTVLEAGCGTGRISHRLALAGAEVICLDITQEALDLARKAFGETPARFVQGSMLDMPREYACDLVWNSGVIEHFKPDDQRRSLAEFLAVLNPGGRVVILIPYANSALYRLGKAVLELLGRWPYGVEVPRRTLADVVPEEGVLKQEYTIGFLSILFDAYKFLGPLKRPLRALWRWSVRLLGRERFLQLDRFLSKIFGGYLLVSVIENRGE